MKKSTSYRETFRRHRLVLSAPIVLAVLIAGYLVVSAPKKYVSATDIWVDTPASQTSSVGTLGASASSPAADEQSLATELLATRYVDVSIAQHSELGQWLRSHPASGPFDAQVVDALKAVNAIVAGPQVVAISYTGPTPAVTTSVLKAVVTELGQSSNRFTQAHGVSALQAARVAAAGAAQAESQAQSQLNDYVNQHPRASATDPTYAALLSNEQNASTEVTQANTALTQAQQQLGQSNLPTKVIDPPSAAVTAGGGKKKKVEGIVGGLIAGVLVSFLGTVALTRGKPDPWEDELVNGPAFLRDADTPVVPTLVPSPRSPTSDEPGGSPGAPVLPGRTYAFDGAFRRGIGE